MKNLKKSFAILAIVLGTTGAFAAKNHTAHRQSDVLWGRHQDGSFTQTDENTSCTASDAPCKVLYPAGQDPNDDASGGTIVEDNGFIQ